MITPDQIKGLTLTLPLPSRKLSPNARVHFMVRAREVKALRKIAAMICANSVCGMKPKWTKAIEKTTFFFTKNANRDGDNHLSMMKPVWDGLQDAGLVADDSGITHEPVEFQIDKENPRVEVWIRKAE